MVKRQIHKRLYLNAPKFHLRQLKNNVGKKQCELLKLLQPQLNRQTLVAYRVREQRHDLLPLDRQNKVVPRKLPSLKHLRPPRLKLVLQHTRLRQKVCKKTNLKRQLLLGLPKRQLVPKLGRQHQKLLKVRVLVVAGVLVMLLFNVVRLRQRHLVRRLLRRLMFQNVNQVPPPAALQRKRILQLNVLVWILWVVVKLPLVPHTKVHT